jgi:hypothetical protein
LLLVPSNGLRVPHNTISLVLREVCAAIVMELRDELLAPPQNAAELDGVVIGAIDGKHIASASCLHAAASSSCPGNSTWASSSVP